MYCVSTTNVEKTLDAIRLKITNLADSSQTNQYHSEKSSRKNKRNKLIVTVS